jgi:dTDP-4-dehydrorhamnose reductase
MNKLTILGNGYTARFLSKEALKKGFEVSIVSRNITKPKKNIHYLNFFDSNNVSKNLKTQHIISTIPPNENGHDPVIVKYGKSIASNTNHVIYLSATSVYGNGEVNEQTKPNPKSKRGKIRLSVEKEWVRQYKKSSIFRISGIYGPKRHPMIKYLNGDNTVIVKKDLVSNRIHVEDLSAIVIKFLKENQDDRVVNVSDQNIINNFEAINYVTNKLQLKKPFVIDYKPEEMPDMLKTFYEINRIVKTKVIGHHFIYKMRHPDYKEALLELTKKIIKINK